MFDVIVASLRGPVGHPSLGRPGAVVSSVPIAGGGRMQPGAWWTYAARHGVSAKRCIATRLRHVNQLTCVGGGRKQLQHYCNAASLQNGCSLPMFNV